MQARLAQLVERKALNLVVVGSSPTVGTFYLSADSEKNGLQPSRWNKCFECEGPVAQWIRHRSTEPEIVGSSPTRVSYLGFENICECIV